MQQNVLDLKSSTRYYASIKENSVLICFKCMTEDSWLEMPEISLHILEVTTRIQPFFLLLDHRIVQF